MASSPPQGCNELKANYWALVDSVTASEEDIEEARVAWELLCATPEDHSGGGPGGKIIPPR